MVLTEGKTKTNMKQQTGTSRPSVPPPAPMPKNRFMTPKEMSQRIDRAADRVCLEQDCTDDERRKVRAAAHAWLGLPMKEENTDGI